MWLYLRNILAREQVTPIDASRQAHLKRKSPRGVVASVALLSSAIAALTTPDVSGVAAKPLSQAASAGPSGLAMEWAMLGAQPLLPDAVSRTGASDLPLLSAVHVFSDGAYTQPFARDTLRGRPVTVLPLNESVLVALCRTASSLCAPLEAPSSPHEWSGRVAAVRPASAGVVSSGEHAALSGAAPLVMATADAGTYAGQIKAGSSAAWTPVGLPEDLAAQLKQILEGQLDATRPAQAGDYYRVVYESPEGTTAGSPHRRVTALEIRLAGRTYRAVWFAAPGRNAGDYYSFDGQRLIAEPFAMPLNYVRVSSPFGYRIHPVTGEPAFHTGVDLTAAQGTPVVAAAAGTVQFIGVDSGYGKHVVVRHAGGYTTYYAHLSAFAGGLRVGAQIRRGDPLGAVGQTGVATGPHLHFEVRLNNQPVDPLTLTSRVSAAPLAGRPRAAFEQVASIASDHLAALHG
ncbi:M23 family metallopeptidase [Paraburkholderia sp. BCC1885]|uniref:M23 family metallopeptidase n=1 Tax=Paraburkholderia sp. BCC1885 TaxID=2562669 RepID=UPI001183CE51|nr:M23 family metallopeptidase [Paraburkholderia sp. BCC1885]